MGIQMSEDELRRAIRSKVVQLAANLGKKASNLTDDEVLLENGLLDSASVLELLVWLETTLNLELEQDELSLDNFGSIEAMVGFLRARLPQ